MLWFYLLLESSMQDLRAGGLSFDFSALVTCQSAVYIYFLVRQQCAWASSVKQRSGSDSLFTRMCDLGQSYNLLITLFLHLQKIDNGNGQ